MKKKIHFIKKVNSPYKPLKERIFMKTIKIKRCTMTATGEHIWTELPPDNDKYYGGIKLKRWFFKCTACGFVDDRKNK